MELPNREEVELTYTLKLLRKRQYLDAYNLILKDKDLTETEYDTIVIGINRLLKEIRILSKYVEEDE